MSAASALRTTDATRDLGRVYTPPALARWVAERLVREIPSGLVTVADPACGDGALLAAVEDVRPGTRLVGADIDRDGVTAARAALPRATLAPADSLMVDAEQPPPDAWRRALGVGRVDGVVLNPPWGARLPAPVTALRRAGYTLAHGQFDSASIFTELALGMLAQGGVAALILPDSLFSPAQERLRRHLLQRTELLLVARLGEGFFAGVYRGTVVVVCRRGEAPRDHLVRCAQLDAAARKRVLVGGEPLEAEIAAVAHEVPQRRFSSAPGTRFDVAVREDERRTLRVIETNGGEWTRWLTSGRGVELSKLGLVVVCPRCATAEPAPRRARGRVCPQCALELPASGQEPRAIVRMRDEAPAGWRPLVAGEDVDRYRVEAGRRIEPGVPGINYKDEGVFAARRLLVRKTGVGLKAAIHPGGAYTTQVVFHYIPRPGAPAFYLEYVLGVLSSRILLAAHLARTGESQWRSHPYVTQHVLARLPIPALEPGTWRWRQAQAIAEAVRARGAGEPDGGERDLRIERLVGGLFRMRPDDLEWVVRRLDRAQGLQAIAPLRLSDPRAVQPVAVA